MKYNTADVHSGNVAEVVYEGTASYAQAPVQKAAPNYAPLPRDAPRPLYVSEPVDRSAPVYMPAPAPYHPFPAYEPVPYPSIVPDEPSGPLDEVTDNSKIEIEPITGKSMQGPRCGPINSEHIPALTYLHFTLI